MKGMLKGITAMILVVCFLVGAVPESFVGAVASGIQALAEEADARRAAQAQSEALEGDGWLYRICADGNAELLGYADASVTSLVLPEALGGAWVTRLAEDAFARNEALRSVTIPAQIAEIPDSAFPGQENMTVYAYSGTAALAFAERRGFSQRSRSKYDFYEDILDLSELKPGQWSVSGTVLRLEEPYARFAVEGARIFLPPDATYIQGLPVQLKECRYEGDGAMANFDVMKTVDVLRSYHVEDAEMIPDLEHVQILSEGVTLLNRRERWEFSKSAKKTLNLDLKIKVKPKSGVGELAFSGKLDLTPEATISVDFSFRGLNYFKITTAMTQKYDAKASVSTERKNTRSNAQPLLDVPLYSAALVSLMFRVSAVVTAEGNLDIVGEVYSEMSFGYDGGKTFYRKTKDSTVDISACFSVEFDLVASLSVTVGFPSLAILRSLNLSFDVAKLSLTVGIEGKMEFSNSETSIGDKKIECNELGIHLKLKLSASLFNLAKEISDKLKVNLEETDIDVSSSYGKMEVSESELKYKIFDLDIPIASIHFERVNGGEWKQEDHCTVGRVEVRLLFGDEDQTELVTYVKLGDKIPDPSGGKDQGTIVREGYKLQGWFYTADREAGSLLTKWDFEKLLTSDDHDVDAEDRLTLTAVWVEDEDSASNPAGETILRVSNKLAEKCLRTNLTGAQYNRLQVVGYADLADDSFDRSLPIELNVPKTIDGWTIVEICDGAFLDWKRLASIVLPDCIEKMGDSVFDGSNLVSVNWPRGLKETSSVASPFAGASGLHTMEIPEKVYDLPANAFRRAENITAVQLPSTLQTIGEKAFAESGIEKIEIPVGVTEIPKEAFYKSELTSISLPDGLTTIGDRAFAECKNLKRFEMPDSVTTVSESAFEGTQLESLKLSKNLNMSTNELQSLISGIKNIEFGESMEEIPDKFFAGVSTLENITLPGSLKRIGYKAFYHCKNLRRVTIHDGAQDLEICRAAFAESGLERIDLPENLKVIRSWAFCECANLRNIELPDGVTTMGSWAFGGCPLTYIQIPKSWKEIGEEGDEHWYDSPMSSSRAGADDNEYADDDKYGEQLLTGFVSPFAECTTLERVKISEGLTELPECAFNNTSIASIQLPNSLKRIKSDAFAYCSNLKEISLPGNLETIDNYAFYETAIREFVIPASVTTIGLGAFEKDNVVYENICTNYTVRFMGDVKNIEDYIFFEGWTDIYEDPEVIERTRVDVYLPETATKLEKYMQEMYFSNKRPEVCPEIVLHSISSSYHNVYWADTGETMIPSSMVMAGKPVNPPQEIPEKLGFHFAGWCTEENCKEEGECWDFEKDIMPNADLTLFAKWRADSGSYEYEKVGTEIKLLSYVGKDSIVEVPAELAGFKVVAIGEECFPGGVTQLTIPASIGEIDSQAFCLASDLESIRIKGSGAYSARDGVLYKGFTLAAYPQARRGSSFAIPSGITSLGDYSIYECSNLEALTVPASVKVLGSYTIYGCPKLREVDFDADVSIGENSLLCCNMPLDDDDPLNDGELLNVFGPDDALNLKNYADGKDVVAGDSDQEEIGYKRVNYNMYDVTLYYDSDELWTGKMRSGEKIFDMLPPREELFDGELEVGLLIGWSLNPVSKYEFELEKYQMPQDTRMTPEIHNLYALIRLYPDYSMELVSASGVAARSSGEGIRLVKYDGSDTRVIVPSEINGVPVVEIAEDCFPDKSITLVGDKGSVAEKYAQDHGMNFEARTYTLRFATNGGRTIAPRTLCATDPIDELPIPTRTGYEFVEWCTDVTLSEKWTDEAMPNHNLTLYASWKRLDESAPVVPFRFREEGETVVITGYTGINRKVEIPATINELPVVKIADRAFADNPFVQSVTLPESVTEIGSEAFARSALFRIEMPGATRIGENAFADCAALSNVALSEGLSELGDGAFLNCSALMQIALPDSLAELGEDSFNGCANLIAANLPANLSAIPSGTFTGCRHLRSIQLGAQVSSIAANAFNGCDELARIGVAEGNMYYTAVENVLFNAAGTQLMLYPRGKSDAAYAIPDGVLTIADGGMKGARVQKLTLNEQLSSIGASALSGCAFLTEIEFNGALSSIGERAFEGCRSLTELSLPDGVQVGKNAFDATSLTSIRVPENVQLGANAIPAREGLTIYGKGGSAAERYAESYGIRFVDESRDVPVTGISLSEQSLTLKPGETAELRASLTPEGTTEREVVWSSSNRAIAVVDGGKVEARALGEAVITATAASGATAQCAITVQRGPARAQSIRLSTTALRLSVGSVRPVTAEVLPKGALDGALTWTIENADVADWFGGCVVGKAKGETTLTATTAGGLSASCQITVTESSVKPMDKPDFSLPTDLTSIEAEAFTGLAMKVVDCPAGLLEIGSRAFADCAKLRQIYIPASVREIAEDAFEGCASGLTIYCEYDSVAESYAQTHGYACEVIG